MTLINRIYDNINYQDGRISRIYWNDYYKRGLTCNELMGEDPMLFSYLIKHDSRIDKDENREYGHKVIFTSI